MQVGIASPSSPSNIEYAIYAYDHYDQNDFGRNRWQLIRTSRNHTDIISHAENLFLSQEYQKVEVKKNFFHEKKGRNVSATYRVFENRKKHNLITITAVFLLALTSLGIFYLQSF